LFLVSWAFCWSSVSSAVREKTIIAIDKYCDETLRPGARPDCGGYPDGAMWTGFVNTVVDAMINPTFCESPSGAFIE
jgi:hypothetical protein